MIQIQTDDDVTSPDTNLLLFSSLLEPIGGAGPKFNSKSETSSFKVQQLSIYALLCPAQGFPIPSFR